MKNVILTLLSFTGICLVAQNFPGAVGDPTSTAVFKSDARVDYWLADSVKIERGLIDASDPSLGQVTYGDDHFALGQSDPQVVSLGDGGQATYVLSNPISDIEGFDFAVFENAFDNHFLELAFVEVSTDGETFVRFVNQSNTDTDTQTGGFAATDTRNVNNLAGKYRAQYGTPFDLNELEDSLSIDINNINYIRIIDVVGSIDPAYGTKDSYGNFINDPWPTPFNSSGFDLDAVAVLKPSPLSVLENNIESYYNSSLEQVVFSKEIDRVEVSNVLGQKIAIEQNVKELNLSDFQDRILILVCTIQGETSKIKIVK
ncbi:MAG: T9SS C-terminal target domain-containing protein [Flavobacteriales bacterium]